MTDLANKFKDFRSGRSGKCMVKYFIPPTTKYFFISFMISLGVPTITTLGFFSGYYYCNYDPI
jgi:hypothetical protein